MTSTSRSYFEQMYRNHADPWGFESSLYEQRKYAVTVASLPRSRYCSAYEPGCSVGVLTELLATRCDRLLSSDIIPSALQTRRGPAPKEPPRLASGAIHSGPVAIWSIRPCGAQ